MISANHPKYGNISLQSDEFNKKLIVGTDTTVDYSNLTYKIYGGENDGEVVDINDLTDIGLYEIGWENKESTGNTIWQGKKKGTNETKPVYYYQIMNTKVEYKKENSAIILEEDKNSIEIEYNIEKTDRDEPDTPKYNGIITDGEVAANEKDIFKEGDEKWLVHKRDGQRSSFNTNAESQRLDIYSMWRKADAGKYCDLKLIGNFINEKHKKYYRLTIDGNDETGWTVTLGSNLQERKDTKDREVDYTTKKIYDNNLEEGTTIVEQGGENGLVRDTIRTIYLPGADGKEEIVDQKVTNSETIKKIVEKIIRIGTKKKTPDTPILPDNPDTEIPDDQEDLTPEERDELDKLIQDLLDEINKEEETPDTKPEDTKKPTENEEVKPSGNEEVKPSENEETKKPEKEEGKKDTANPVKTKPAAQKANKNASPKTGVTGSAAIAALGISSLIASLGLRKKND